MSITKDKCLLVIYITFLSGLAGNPVFAIFGATCNWVFAHLLLYILHMQMSMNKVLLFCGGGGRDIRVYGKMSIFLKDAFLFYVVQWNEKNVGAFML